VYIGLIPEEARDYADYTHDFSTIGTYASDFLAGILAFFGFVLKGGSIGETGIPKGSLYFPMPVLMSSALCILFFPVI